MGRGPGLPCEQEMPRSTLGDHTSSRHLDFGGAEGTPGISRREKSLGHHIILVCQQAIILWGWNVNKHMTGSSAAWFRVTQVSILNSDLAINRSEYALYFHAVAYSRKEKKTLK